MERADAQKPNMGLTVWKGNIVRKGDIIIAKNYLQEDEIDKLNRLVNLFLESAELRVQSKQDLTLNFWRNTVEGLLSFQGYDILDGCGSISNEDMKRRVGQVYDKFNAARKRHEALRADEEDLKFLENIEKEIKERSIGK